VCKFARGNTNNNVCCAIYFIGFEAYTNPQGTVALVGRAFEGKG
jgi:hypothetical protein